ncbi:MAG: hypothetical protein A2445_00085 [Candidatus Jacksonbacteria bacterium RIFOXYC2_FULL_44_29]|nr:MAG: IlvE [Parcubacteria group bacterium GW2011_GWC2_44_22]OGY75716.1 MAG: hypothetical protein A2240_06215 [Candidatus Jacksonbacteria bacterium RIFOXYA2_FULL_43_12]OGY76282.1 MAG: hypothetical protein A2295_00700 [Candidatus Jacksonbacteria bacterium RIFOXYB2_FULL_44_15]OGY78105.1 MAG: hypothetical protein A2445_00085 [Candidatus Jacksonbacteria bacterium RIFOXYC2_FULL_44_29]HCC50151.1 hypothetical protein [Candidatus Jacksonbacteria bacterium]
MLYSYSEYTSSGEIDRNGVYYLGSKVFIPADDIAFSRGYGVFTVCVALNGKVFRLKDHVDRLLTSTRAIGLPIAYDENELTGKIMSVVNRNFVKLLDVDSRNNERLLVKVIITGGPEADNHISPAGPGLLHIAVSHLQPPKEAITVATYPFQRQDPGVKLLNYTGASIGFHQMRKIYPTIDDVMFVSPQIEPTRQYVLECSTAAVWSVHLQAGTDKILVCTPPLQGILASITRQVIFEVVEKKLSQFEFREMLITRSQIKTAREVFKASSTGIVPVTKIDDTDINRGQIGPVTKAVQSVYIDYQNEICGLI